MRTFGWTPTEEELKDLVNVIDVDGNGDISFNEFVWLMTKSVQTDGEGDENGSSETATLRRKYERPFRLSVIIMVAALMIIAQCSF